jgi:hypothetical protein
MSNPTTQTAEIDKLPPLPADLPASPVGAAMAIIDPARQAGVTPPDVRRAISRQADGVTVIGSAALPPFDLDRQLLLEELNSPLVVPGANPTARDLGIFLFACADVDAAWREYDAGGIPAVALAARTSRICRGITLAEVPALLAYLNPGLPDAGKAEGQTPPP